MKRSLIFVLALAFFLTACSKPVQNDATPYPTVEPEPSPSQILETYSGMEATPLLPSDSPLAKDTPNETTGTETVKPTTKPSQKPTAARTPKPSTPKPVSTPKPAATEKPAVTPRQYGSGDTIGDMDPDDYKARYVGSKESDKYHYTSCRHAKRILIVNAIWWKSIEGAKSDGYIACGTCKPG